jgi:hypothetical protein
LISVPFNRTGAGPRRSLFIMHEFSKRATLPSFIRTKKPSCEMRKKANKNTFLMLSKKEMKS